MKLLKKKILEQKRHWRVRRNLAGTAERPRLSLSLTNKHIYAQCIDDHAGKTLVSLCSTSKEVKGEKLLPNVEGAKNFGDKFGAKLKSAGITQIAFDRGSRRYHGAVKSFAEAVRSAGINF